MIEPIQEASVKLLSRIANESAKRTLRQYRVPREIDAIIHTALENVDYRVSDIVRTVNDRLGWQISQNVTRFLASHKLFSDRERMHVRSLFEEFLPHFTGLLHAPDRTAAREAYKQIQTWQQQMRVSQRITPILARLLLIHERQQQAAAGTQASMQISTLIDQILDCTFPDESLLIANTWMQIVAETFGAHKPPSLSERLSQMIQQVDRVAEERETREIVDAETLIEINEDLRAALFGLKSELGNVQEQVRTLQATSAEAATARFLSDLNSQSSNSLLDNLMHSNRAVNGLLAAGWTPDPPEIEGVVYTLKMMADYLQRIGITPVYEIGSIAEISMSDLSEVSYIGSEFTDESERKRVRFRSPGWRYQQYLVSLPQAIEIRR